MANKYELRKTSSQEYIPRRILKITRKDKYYIICIQSINFSKTTTNYLKKKIYK
jgi:hypothetical protein